MRVGFIGLGRMRLPMSQQVVRAGHDVTVYNRTRAKEIGVVQLGARAAGSPLDVSRHADIVLACLPSLEATRQVFLGVNGNRKPHICGNRTLHTPGEDVSGGADILPVMPVGRVGLDAGSGATGVLANTRREASDPAVTWRLPHAVRPTLSSASADAPASGSCCPGC